MNAELALRLALALEPPKVRRRPQMWSLEDLLERYIAGRLGVAWPPKLTK